MVSTASIPPVTRPNTVCFPSSQGQASAVSAALGGCSKSEAGEWLPDIVWGKLGANPGQFSKPRAITIDDKDQLYIVDMTARIQVFDSSTMFRTVDSAVAAAAVGDDLTLRLAIDPAQPADTTASWIGWRPSMRGSTA